MMNICLPGTILMVPDGARFLNTLIRPESQNGTGNPIGILFLFQ
jgi:hypothetical protein